MRSDRGSTGRGDPTSWRGARELVRVLAQPHNLRRTIPLALVVGTLLFVINQLDVVLAGQASTGVVLKIALTYLVPFAVSNYGIAVATHAPPDRSRRPESPA